MRLSGWGRHPSLDCLVYRPEREAELAEIVARAPTPSLVSRGMGRSYGDAALNEGEGVILHQRFDRFLDFDESTGVLSCEAAVTLSEIIDVVLPRGFFLPITPGTKFISVGGAIAADVHGKNHHRDGTISSQLIDFRLLTGTGAVLRCSREENPDLFWATLGGMGLTGAILDARLRVRRVETSYVEQSTLRCRDLDTALERILSEDRDYEYAMGWIDCLSSGRSLGRSVLLRANPAPRDALPVALRETPHAMQRALPLRVPFELPQLASHPIFMRLVNQVLWHAKRDGHRVAHVQSYFYPLDAIRNWNRLFGRRGVLQYQVVLPLAQCREGMIELLERIARSGAASPVAVLKGTGPANQSPLSFPIEGASLAVDFPNRGPAVFGLLGDLDRIVAARGGRVYLAKDSCVSAGHFREMYPGLERFREIKAKYDPDGRFSSSLARRLGIVERA